MKTGRLNAIFSRRRRNLHEQLRTEISNLCRATRGDFSFVEMTKMSKIANKKTSKAYRFRGFLEN